MLKKIVQYLFFGICWGCFFFVFMCIIFDLAGNTGALQAIYNNFTRQAISSILVGIACASTSIVYQFERLAYWQKILIHAVVGLGVFAIIAVSNGWIQGFSTGQAIAYFLFVIAGFFIIQSGFYLYYRVEAKKMNERIKEFEKECED